MSIAADVDLHTDWIVKVAQTAAVEAVHAALAKNPGMTARAGTVADIGDEEGSGITDPVVSQALVVPDGSDEPIEADSITAHPVRPGDRVYMLMVPPHGAVVIGRIRVSDEVDELEPMAGLIIQDTPGTLSFYDPDGNKIGQLSTLEWSMGDLPTGHRFTMDPVGGLRFRSETDILLSNLDQFGLAIRDEATGIAVAELSGGSLVIRDPVSTNDIVLRTASVGVPPPPVYRSAVEANPSSSLVSPVAPLFGADDYEIAHVAALLTGTLQSATMTPPAGFTERADDVYNTGADAATLQASWADRDPATGAAATFTSSQTNWQSAIGTKLIVRGGGASSPSLRSTATTAAGISSGQTKSTVLATMPAGVAAGDLLVAIVALGNKGGGVPTGWNAPEGFFFLGANFRITGSGANQSTLAVGAWAKAADAGDVGLGTQAFTVSWGTGTKRVLVHAIAVQNPFRFPGGPDIRIGGHAIGRGFVHRESRTTASGAVTAETAAISTAAFPVFAGRVYEVTYSTVVGTAVGPTADSAFTLRQGVGATGTIFGGGGRGHCPNTGTHVTGMTPGYFTPTADGNITLTLTIQSVSGGSVNHRLTAAGDRWLLVKDIGSTDDINFAIPLTP
jgi:hypothetical protein